MMRRAGRRRARERCRRLLSCYTCHVPPPRVLRNDPIQEAVVDFRVAGAKLSQPTDLVSLPAALASTFPDREERKRAQTTVEFKDGALVTRDESTGFFGVFFKSADGLTIAQFRPDGFTLNRLRPYIGWDALLPLALDTWDAYVAVAQPEHVNRIALRFINRLDIPLDDDRNFESYLRAAPVVPIELPQMVAGFQTRVTLAADGGAMANIVQTSEPMTSSDRMVIFLDIDVFQSAQMPTSRNAVGAILQSLRVLKNRVFFESLTEKTLGVFE